MNTAPDCGQTIEQVRARRVKTALRTETPGLSLISAQIDRPGASSDASGV
jgi:hypothetical protein